MIDNESILNDYEKLSEYLYHMEIAGKIVIAAAHNMDHIDPLICLKFLDICGMGKKLENMLMYIKNGLSGIFSMYFINWPSFWTGISGRDLS
ncbi:Transmembrane protein [Dirofilaria immitis]